MTVSRTPVFPGHDHAHQLHASVQAPVSYPDFLRDTYAINPDTATVQALTQAMRHGQLPAASQLNDALWQIERIALATEAR